MTTVDNSSLCKSCEYKFRRVFIPSESDEYYDEDENIISPEEGTIAIINLCLISGMDLENEITVECSKYKKKTHKGEDVPFFKHL